MMTMFRRSVFVFAILCSFGLTIDSIVCAVDALDRHLEVSLLIFAVVLLAYVVSVWAVVINNKRRSIKIIKAVLASPIIVVSLVIIGHSTAATPESHGDIGYNILFVAGVHAGLLIGAVFICELHCILVRNID